MALQHGGGKLYGKTNASVRRRKVTRRSGNHVTKGSTGGTYKVLNAGTAYVLSSTHPITLTFQVPQTEGKFSGFGLWFATDLDDPADLSVTVAGSPERVHTKAFPAPDWGKCGSTWIASTSSTLEITAEFRSTKPTTLHLYQPSCGLIDHADLERLPARLTQNMYLYSPETLFIGREGSISTEGKAGGEPKSIYLKNCNRCGRYLPINTVRERNHLSFSNHCVAPSRVPCKDSTFSRLKRPGEDEASLILTNGFQLECRFCKKLYVNSAHNPRRTNAQMREDGTRRRAFEMLVNNAMGYNASLRYRQEHQGRELHDDVWQRFDKRCFHCGVELSSREMQLDHTRPLALLFPLDETATALCKSCNGDKRDRAPADFYSPAQLARLAHLTGLSISDLMSTYPNLPVLDALWERQDWVFSEFFSSVEFDKIREGKDTRLLIIKALQKASERAPKAHRHDFEGAFQAFLRNRN